MQLYSNQEYQEYVGRLAETILLHNIPGRLANGTK